MGELIALATKRIEDLALVASPASPRSAAPGHGVAPATLREVARPPFVIRDRDNT
jgi:hypothetical protein